MSSVIKRAILVVSLVLICTGVAKAFAWGTGTFISNDGYILTDAHVITSDGKTVPKTISILTGYPKKVISYKVRFISMLPDQDIALLKLDGQTTTCLKVSQTPVKFQGTYYTVQFNHYTEKPPFYFVKLPIVNTTINELSGVANEPYIITHLMDYWYTKTIRPGNSGSAIINNKNEIVDLIEVGNGQTIAGSIVNTTINNFLKDFKIECKNASRLIVDAGVIVFYD